MRSLALTVLLAGCVQPQPDSGARYTLTHYLAEIRLEDKQMPRVKWIVEGKSEEGEWCVRGWAPTRGGAQAIARTVYLKHSNGRLVKAETRVSKEASR